ncbi:MAG: LPXTG cell wall anchor domain-containing protein [Chitinophagaceae bacterium]
MTNIFIYKATIFSVTVFFALSAIGQDITTVKATVDKSKILIGEPIRLQLEADIPENEAIRFFDTDSIPHFEFLHKEKIDTVNTGKGTILSQVIHITSWDSGHWVLPSFILGERKGTDTIPVDVGFTPFDPEQPYHDTKDIIEVNPTEKKQEFSWWYIAAGAIIVLVLLIFIFRKKKKPVIPVIELPHDPYKEAMEQLEKLQKNKPVAKEYYSRLVDIFREYVATKKGILSLQATTVDFVAQLKTLQFTGEQFEELSLSLRQSDFVKFAKYIPSAEEDKRIFDLIFKTIQQIEVTK